MPISRLAKQLAIVSTIAAVSGCCALNELTNPQEAFATEQNRKIGQNIEIHLKNIPPDLRPEVRRIDEHTADYIIGDPHFCYYAITVDTSSGIIETWRYLGDAAKCKTDTYYCGE